MIYWILVLSLLATIASFSVLFYRVGKAIKENDFEISKLKTQIAAYETKSERKHIESAVKIISLDKKVAASEELMKISKDHSEAQFAVLSQRITNMKKNIVNNEE